VSAFKTFLVTTLLLLANAQACADEHSTRQLNLNGVSVRIEFPDSAFRGGTEPLLEWIRRSLGIVSAYYGTFPMSSLRIQSFRRMGWRARGKTWGYRGGFIRVQVGREVTAAQLLDDWVLVHEMTHLALPDVGDDQSWFSEGLAVYVEGVAREQAGNRTQQDVFAEQMRQMPRGMPQAGDRGWITPIRGGERTGAELCSVSWRMSKFIAGREIDLGCRTQCVPLRRPAGGYRRTGQSIGYSLLRMQRPAPRCWKSSTRR